MEVDERRFRKMFPHLAKEVKGEENRISITSVQSDIDSREKATSKKLQGYNPDIIDFLRRCNNESQAREIIKYLEQKEKISCECACNLRRQLRKKGLRSFGAKKKEAYYLRQTES